MGTFCGFAKALDQQQMHCYEIFPVVLAWIVAGLGYKRAGFLQGLGCFTSL